MEKLDLKPPKIIVIGNESHGKSTLLERIIGLPLFPKEKGICTRCVIRVHLRRCPAGTPAIAEITTVSTLTYGRPPPSPVIFTALDNIREKIQYVMDGLVKNDKQRRMIIDDHEIVVKLQLPYCLNLDILDVPGLVTTTPAGVTQNLPQVTHDLAMKIVQQEKESSIYLLVNDIRVPPNQSRGCAVIQQAKVENQTLGVFTKLDTFVSEDGDEVRELEQLLTGKAKYSFPVKSGWIAAASKKPVDFISSGVKSELSLFSIMSRKEDELFTHKFSPLLP
jgi:GTP-binding protein EngB required for normal cell division